MVANPGAAVDDLVSGLALRPVLQNAISSQITAARCNPSCAEAAYVNFDDTRWKVRCLHVRRVIRVANIGTASRKTLMYRITTLSLPPVGCDHHDRRFLAWR